MSGYPRQGNRFPPGRMNNSNAGPRTVWKPKPKIATDGSLDGASCQKDDLPLTDDGSKHMGSVSTSDDSLKESLTVCSQSDPSCMHLITPKNQPERESDPTAETQPESDSITDFNLKDPTLSSSEGQTEKGNQIGDVSHDKTDSSRKAEDTDHASPMLQFDICPKKVNRGVKLKLPQHLKNREKRNEAKRILEGKNIMILRPGMVLMKKFLSYDDQIGIVKVCREFGIGDGGFYQPGYREGAKLHLKMMCLGKNWDPQSSKYSEIRPIDNAKPPGIPDNFRDMVKRALRESNAHVQKETPKADAGKMIPPMSPDICIVNFYTKSGKLGLHQDKDESTESLKRGLPVVSFSIGDAAEFLYGDDRDVEKADKVVLESGDVLIFGGTSRHVFHGVASIHPNTAPELLMEETNMLPGRLNLTFRQY